MLYDILLILIVVFVSYFFFRLGFKAGKGIEPKVSYPTLKRNTKADKKNEILMKNIENYDGTSNNQVRL